MLAIYCCTRCGASKFNSNIDDYFECKTCLMQYPYKLYDLPKEANSFIASRKRCEWCRTKTNGAITVKIRINKDIIVGHLCSKTTCLANFLTSKAGKNAIDVREQK